MNDTIRLQLLSFAMRVDSIVLLALGLGVLFAPEAALELFNFGTLPQGVNFILGMYGAVLATMGLAYLIGGGDPVRNIVLVRIGIWRAAIEIFMAAYWIAVGAVSLNQGAAGVFIPFWFGLAYSILFPRDTVGKLEESKNANRD